jgi:hypothetical protein
MYSPASFWFDYHTKIGEAMDFYISNSRKIDHYKNVLSAITKISIETCLKKIATPFSASGLLLLQVCISNQPRPVQVAG